MAAPTRPAGVTAFLKETWYYVPTIADVEAPTLAEVNAATGLDLTCRMYREGGGELSSTTERATSPSRVCDEQQFERITRTTVSITDLHVSFDPQGASGSEGKAAFEELTSGVTGYLVRRQGIQQDTALAAGQFVDVVPVEFGEGLPTKTGTDEAAEFSALIPTSIIGPAKWNVAIAA